MTPKKKAKELVEKMFNTGSALYAERIRAKESALIAANEAERAELDVLTKLKIITDKYTSDYWQQVKIEIEKL